MEETKTGRETEREKERELHSTRDEVVVGRRPKKKVWDTKHQAGLLIHQVHPSYDYGVRGTITTTMYEGQVPTHASPKKIMRGFSRIALGSIKSH